ncbi:secreted protein [Melampsora americana]|nr:secreted protein [Melampsora americana]KAH9811395.1 secreted protein [Melampsora americana]
MAFSIKIASVIITLFGLISSKQTPTAHYQSQCCPYDNTACYSQPSFCSDNKYCKPNIADYLCDASGGSCHPSNNNTRAAQYFQCGYQPCYGEFKCVTIVFSEKTQSGSEGSSNLIPSSVAKGQDA